MKKSNINLNYVNSLLNDFKVENASKKDKLTINRQLKQINLLLNKLALARINSKRK